MLEFAAFTSMSESYYQRTGKHMITSYRRFWQGLMPLYVYNEDNFNINENWINYRGWDLGKEYEQFQTRHQNNRVKTFAKKGFSIIDAMNKLPAVKMLWLDADVIINQSMDKEFLRRLLPDNTLSTHFSVWHKKDNVNYHSCETGFFMLNKKHKGFKDFKNVYTDIYHNDKTEGLRRFYDGEVYGKTVDAMSDKGYIMNNLTKGKHLTPMKRSIIKNYVTHMKAGLKDKLPG
jgi:hypothetical protein